MQGINRLNINWVDDNHARVQDPDNGRVFNVTVRPKTNMWTSTGRPVKPRLYIGGAIDELSQTDSRRKQIAWAKDYFGPTLKKILNRDVELKFSQKAGCSCGCSPGFIIQDGSIPFDIWMDAVEEDPQR